MSMRSSWRCRHRGPREWPGFEELAHDPAPLRLRVKMMAWESDSHSAWPCWRRCRYCMWSPMRLCYPPIRSETDGATTYHPTIALTQGGCRWYLVPSTLSTDTSDQTDDQSLRRPAPDHG